MIAPNPVCFTIFGFDIMWYGVLIGSAFVIGTIITYLRAPSFKIKSDFVLDLIIWIIPFAIIGSRAYYVLFNIDQYTTWQQVFSIRSGGLAIHGGLLFSFVTAYFVCKANKVKVLDAFDLFAPAVVLGQAIGRWGNFFNEEAHGTQTDLPWAQIIDGVGYHPTFLYESIWCLIVAIILFTLFSAKRRKFHGQVVCMYGILYSIERFFVEALRTDSLMIGPLKQAQVISLVILISCIFLYTYFRKNKRIR